MPVLANPRLRGVRSRVNDRILQDAVRHSVYLERLKTREVNQIVGFLNTNMIPSLLEDLRRRLDNIRTRGFDTSVAATQRLRDLAGSANDLIRGGITEASGQLRKSLIGIAVTESEWQSALLRSAVPFQHDFTTPSLQVLTSAITSKPMEGKLLKDWWSELGRATQKKVSQQINLGLARGEGTDDIVRRLAGTREAQYSDGILQDTRRNIAAVVRTSVNHATTHAREETYNENADVVKAVQIVATLDARTTIICQSMDGKVFAPNEGPRPPFHMGCRTTTVPVLKSWDELGIKGLKEIPGRTRASMDGEVPASLTYPEWLKTQTEDVQNEALGPTRAELFRRDKVTIDNFVDDRGKMLTLDELRKKENLPDTELFAKANTLAASEGSTSKAATTALDAAYAKAKTRDDVAKLLASEKPFEHTEIDLSYIDDASAREIGSALARFARDVPDAAHLTYIRTVDDLPSMALAAYERTEILGQNGIVISRRMFKSKAKAVAVMEEASNSGWLVGKDISATIIHETGHAVDYSLADASKRARDFIKRMPPEPGELSQYAVGNSREAFAEGWTAIHVQPREQWSKWTQAFASKLVQGFQETHTALPAALEGIEAGKGGKILRVATAKAPSSKLQRAAITGGKTMKVPEFGALTPEEILAVDHAKLPGKVYPSQMTKLTPEQRAALRTALKARDAATTPAVVTQEAAIAAVEKRTAAVASTLTQEEWEASLSQSERMAIKQWSKDGYKRMREIDSGDVPCESYPSTCRHYKALQRALDRAPVYRGSVYRGMHDLSSQTVTKYTTEGSTIRLDAVSSASADEKQARAFSGADKNSMMLRLDTSSGIDIARISESESEREVLLRKGSKYRVEKVDTITALSRDVRASLMTWGSLVHSFQDTKEIFNKLHTAQEAYSWVRALRDTIAALDTTGKASLQVSVRNGLANLDGLLAQHPATWVIGKRYVVTLKEVA